jgi:hypothetical protein
VFKARKQTTKIRLHPVVLSIVPTQFTIPTLDPTRPLAVILVHLVHPITPAVVEILAVVRQEIGNERNIKTT